MHTLSLAFALGGALTLNTLCYGNLLQQYIAPGHLTGNSFGLPGSNATYDYVVVGAGLAGSVVASRLAAALPSMTVAVVEAGSFYEISNGNYSQIPFYSQKFASTDPNDWQPLIDWGVVTEPIPGGNNRRVLYSQGKTLGGSSARNQQIYHRGTKGWYQAIADISGDDAYTWDRMLPFMKKSFSFHPPDVTYRASNATANFSLDAFEFPGGPVQLSYPKYAQPVSSYAAAAYASAGFNASNGFADGNLLGYGYWPFTLNPEDSTRSSTETAFLSPAIAKTSLKIYQSCMARNILFDQSKKAVGVNVTVAGIKPFTLSARKEVIISSGVFHSPQLLMVSGIGPRHTLENLNIPIISELPGVGQNLRDTPNLGGVTYQLAVDGASAFQKTQSSFDTATEHFLSNGSGPLSSPAGDFGAWEKLPARLTANMSAPTRDWLASLPSDWPHVEYVLDASSRAILATESADNLATIGTLLTATRSTGNVTITSADNAAPPVVYIGWLDAPADRQVAVAAYRRAREIARGMACFGAETTPGANVTTDAQILEYIRTQGLTAIHHGAATCAMGRNVAGGAVVDAQARVWGVAGLRVIDTSSLPFSAPGHTQGVTYAHAEKLVQDVIDAAQAG